MFGLTTELILFILRDRVQLSKPSKGLAIVRELFDFVGRLKDPGSLARMKLPDVHHSTIAVISPSLHARDKRFFYRKGVADVFHAYSQSARARA